MKVKALSIILILFLTIKGVCQTDCTEIKFYPTEDEKTVGFRIENTQTHVSLFSQIDLDSQNSISIIYSSDLEEGEVRYSNDVGLLLELADKHSNSQIIDSIECQQYHPEFSFLIIENKSEVHQYLYDEKCKILSTDCGDLKVDLENKHATWEIVQIEYYEEYFTHEEDMKIRLTELDRNGSTLIYLLKDEYVEEIIEIEYDDVNNKVKGIFNDSFYLNLIDEELLPNYENPEHNLKTKEELILIGEILQKILKMETGSDSPKIVTWRQLDNSNKYYIKIKFTKERLSLNIPDFKLINPKRRFRIRFATIK